MSGFDLNSYETVKERKLRFYKDHPDGRITVKIVNSDLDEMAVVQAFVFLNAQDQEKNLPKGVGHALELRDKELQKNKYGKEYESVNYSSWLENCEESAVGRALDNAGYASNGKCSRDEIEKAQRNTQASKPKTIVDKVKAAFPSAKQKSFTVSFGKFKGVDIYTIPKKDLEDYVLFLKRSAADKGKEITGPVLEFINAAEEIVEGQLN